MNLSTPPIGNSVTRAPKVAKPTEPAPRETEQDFKDHFIQSAGVLGGAVQVFLKTPRNLIASALLPPRQMGDDSDIPTMAKDPSLVRAWGLASALGGAILLGGLGSLILGGAIAPAICAGVGAKLFPFVDGRLSRRALNQENAPVYLEGSLSKGESLANGSSKLRAGLGAFTSMTKSSYHEVAEFYSSLAEKRLKPET